jgi:ABC-type transport system involved in multi-copper enzyme maturation permease subunit
MKNILIIIQFTIREALARKAFLFFAGVTLLVLIGTLLFFSLIDFDTLMGMSKSAGENRMVGKSVNSVVVTIIINPLATLGLLFAIFSSASFVPVLLEKGNIDIFLSKPISRTQLLIGKYLGVVLYVFINIFILITGIWLIISVKFGYWDTSFLTLSVMITFAFAVLYALIMFFGVLTKSSVLGMMVAYLIFLILSPVMLLYREKLHEFVSSEFIKTLLDGLYFIIPQTAEIMGLALLDLAIGKGIVKFQPVITSFLFLILFLVFSLSLFKRKDF